MMRPLKDIYWLAGVLEGEGCFGVAGKFSTPVLQVAMTDSDIIARVHSLLGTSSNIRHRKRAENLKEVYVVSVSGQLAAAWMMTLYRVMGKRRQERIKRVLIGWKRAPYKRRDFGVPSYVNGKQNPAYRRLYREAVRHEFPGMP